MSGTLQDVMNATINAKDIELTNQDRVKDEQGALAASQQRGAEHDNTSQHSAPLHTIVQPEVRKSLEATVEATLPAQPQLDDEVLKLLAETDEEGKKYAYPRHFAQLGNRSGFTLYIPVDNGMAEIEFEKGVFSTDDVSLCGAIQFAISRKSGVSAQIREISASHYRSIVERGRQYDRLRGVGSMVHTGDSNPGRSGKPAHELEAENEKLRAQLEAMKAKTAAIVEDVEPKTNMFDAISKT